MTTQFSGKIDFSLLWKTIQRQIYFTGVQALPFVSFVACIVGGLTIAEVHLLSSKLGMGDIVSDVLVSLVIREIGPMIIAFIIIGRSGTAISTEIGNMKVSRELQFLELSGIDKDSYIFIPRLVGVVFSGLGLSIIFSFFAVISGAFMASILASDSILYRLDQLLETLTLFDLGIHLLKSFIFGIIIATLSTYCGFSVSGQPNEVPQQTTHAVVRSIVGCFLFNGVIAFLTFDMSLQLGW